MGFFFLKVQVEYKNDITISQNTEHEIHNRLYNDVTIQHVTTNGHMPEKVVFISLQM